MTHRVEDSAPAGKNSIVAKVEDFIENVTAAATSPIQEIGEGVASADKSACGEEPLDGQALLASRNQCWL